MRIFKLIFILLLLILSSQIKLFGRGGGHEGGHARAGYGHRGYGHAGYGRGYGRGYRGWGGPYVGVGLGLGYPYAAESYPIPIDDDYIDDEDIY